MSDYTPDTEFVREQYTREQPPHIGTVASKSAEFDRWLAAHDREVAARALREAAKAIRSEADLPRAGMAGCHEKDALILEHRADKIRSGS